MPASTPTHPGSAPTRHPLASHAPNAHPVPPVLDLGAPLPGLAGSGHTRVLACLHGRPVGTVDLDLPVDAAEVDAAVRDTLTGPIEAHLAADGLPVDLACLACGLPATASGAACQRDPAAGTVSVVVTACEASPELVRVLDGVAAQDHRADQVVLVDNRPRTSGLAQMLAGLGRPELTCVAEERPGLGNARNAGLAVATGQFVVFTDDDVVVDTGWLRGLVSGFDRDDVACVTGLILPLELRTPSQRWVEEFGGFGKGFERRRFDMAEHRGPSPLYPYNAGGFGSGANGAFRTEALRALGGFDPRLGTGTVTCSGEDLDVFLDVLAQGWAIVYEPSAVLWHAHHAALPCLRRQIRGYGVGLGAIMTKRFVERPRERRQLLRCIPGGLRFLLDPRSGKNQRKTSSYPRSLTLAEIAGVASGPVALWRSDRNARRLAARGAAA